MRSVHQPWQISRSHNAEEALPVPMLIERPRFRALNASSTAFPPGWLCRKTGTLFRLVDEVLDQTGACHILVLIACQC
jgi:hypothetical protein